MSGKKGTNFSGHQRGQSHSGTQDSYETCSRHLHGKDWAAPQSMWEQDTGGKPMCGHCPHPILHQ